MHAGTKNDKIGKESDTERLHPHHWTWKHRQTWTGPLERVTTDMAKTETREETQARITLENTETGL